MLDLELPSGQYSLRGVSFDYPNIYDDGGNTMAFRIDNTIYIVYENPDDGYRSYAYDDITIREAEENELNNFDVSVEISQLIYNDSDILIMKSLATGKEILRVGTDHSDDYYPWCVMEWTPENILSVDNG